ncbi:hypothetical protein [Kozakia baliensis]|uniref:Uncharacterized protein n=1 Tax=Kozakia baliensis TaxID=153496 RepID=A0A1D8UR79_9PROT|nr:hypothetical protein [Kozakia baliensis]AOX16153.1 hypothetical protein A0U89_02340 [Kozakia baliensis]GEL65039.1 hypothetical protein KBA01_23250 [Kozakia baliensis]
MSTTTDGKSTTRTPAGAKRTSAEQIRRLKNETQLAKDAENRALHEVARLRDDVRRLRDSVKHLQDRCDSYADRLEAAHADREELLLLRSKRLDISVAQASQEGIVAVVTGSDPELLRLVAERNDAQEWLEAVRRSTSWRITRPFRVLIRFARKFLRRL